MKKIFRISWQAVICGESEVEAENIEEAVELAKEGKDEGFESYDEHSSWEPTYIYEVNNETNERDIA